MTKMALGGKLSLEYFFPSHLSLDVLRAQALNDKASIMLAKHVGCTKNQSESGNVSNNFTKSHF